MRLDAPSLPGADYIIFAALSANAGVWIPDQLLPIDADYLLLTTTAPPRPPEMINFDGVLDGNGAASALCFVPTNPALS